MSDDGASAPGASDGPKMVKFSTFTGVFTPTLLTILGVIMYVRLGWVVGNAGVMGGWLVMLVAMGITACTALSLSSIATNTRIGAGGPYAIISKSLGLEVGGSIGVPLYLSRPLGVAMYIFGFREGWLWIFPDHPPLLVDSAVFAAIFIISYASANLAFRVQYVIMAVIAASLVAVFASPGVFSDPHEITWFGDYRGFPENGFTGIDFWVVFAVFFPATTGILAGANMSGDLENPRRAIPVGTLWAVAASSVIYFVLAWYAGRMGSPEELTSNYNLLIDRSLFPPVVLAGLLGATFSSALASAVGGPRILMAMAQHHLVPKSEALARVADNGEPRNAILLTAVLSFGCMLMRDLNAIAPLVTMFFLITYLVINIVLLVERSLGLVAFRPTLSVPQIVPFLGALGCIFSMFIVSPTFGLIAVGTVFAIYIWLLRKGVEAEEGDVRSTAFVAVAEWAAAKVTAMGHDGARSWKPNLFVPVSDAAELRGEYPFLVDVCRPEGSVKLFAYGDDPEYVARLSEPIAKVGGAFQEEGVMATWAVIEATDPFRAISYGLQTLQSSFFKPNVMFFSLPRDGRRELALRVIEQGRRAQVGLLVLAMHPKAGMGQRKVVNLWLFPGRPGVEGVEEAFQRGNLNLRLLMGYR
ncbi:MAG: amino acid permease, partial [Nannocystaceae bacterium]